MPEVTALTAFEHNGTRRRGDSFPVSDAHAKALQEAGLVTINGVAEDPSKAAGAKSSASPAARASRQKTAKPSAAGEKKRGQPAA